MDTNLIPPPPGQRRRRERPLSTAEQVDRTIDGLTIPNLLRRNATESADAPALSSGPGPDAVTLTWAQLRSEVGAATRGLSALGLDRGERMLIMMSKRPEHWIVDLAATHLGALPCTLYDTLSTDEIRFIAQHSRASVVVLEGAEQMRRWQPLLAELPDVRAFVVLDEQQIPPGDARFVSYADLRGDGRRADYDSTFEKLTDAVSPQDPLTLVYTSGTTGNPKGALYSHRSTVLHAYASALPNVLNVGAIDTVLPVVPMFHVNAWGLPYSVLLAGAKLVLPGAQLDGKSLYELFEGEGVTFSAGVPTVWLGLINYAIQNDLTFSTFRRTVIGGSACPPAMMDTLIDCFGVQVIHGWGMTEMSPLGTTGGLLARHRALPVERQRAILQKQGHAIYGVDMKIVDDLGAELPWDGQASGHLLVKGPWIIARYFRDEGGDPLVDGWFPTGDVATIDPDGFMQITDRSKDVIKSGGEWIGSIDIENIAMAHPAVLQAACIAMAHPKWDERPLLLVVRKPGQEIGREEMLQWFEGRIAKFWMPDDVVFVEALPIGGTGKVQKNKLREQFKDHRVA